MMRFPVSSLSFFAIAFKSRSNKSAIFETNALRCSKLQEVKMPESKEVRAAVIASKTSSGVACETVATTLWSCGLCTSCAPPSDALFQAPSI